MYFIYRNVKNILSAEAMVDGSIYIDMVETFAFPKLAENEVQIFRQCEISSGYSNVFRILFNDKCSGA